jgi:hypothetical protein
MVEKAHKFNFHCPSVCFGIGNYEKPMRVEEKNFHTYKTRSFLFLLFGPLLFSKLITFSFLFHFKMILNVIGTPP